MTIWSDGRFLFDPSLDFHDLAVGPDGDGDGADRGPWKFCFRYAVSDGIGEDEADICVEVREGTQVDRGHHYDVKAGEVRAGIKGYEDDGDDEEVGRNDGVDNTEGGEGEEDES